LRSDIDERDIQADDDFMVGLGAEKVSHTQKNYLAHVIGVYRFNEEARLCTEEVCQAGMFHSIYGTESFQDFSCR